MIENNISVIDQKVYYKKLKNGLDVYFLNDNSKKNYFVNLVTFYGSNDLEYKSKNSDNYVKSPLGIAHFLEHKVFEMDDGTDPFEFFGRSGTDVNAGTSYYSTKYYIWGTNNFYSNLEYFINMIFNPNFTYENINKERGIIEEEIKMYDDDPNWQLDDALSHNIFHNAHVKDKIAGTIESIKEINVDNLTDAYETFYHPSNMALVIGGNFDINDTLKLIENHDALSNRVMSKPILKKKIEEPRTVLKEYQMLEGNIVIPKLKYSFKIKKDVFSKYEPLVVNLYLNCIFSSLFGTTSDFFDEVYKNRLTTGYYYEHFYYDDYYILSIEAESDKADLFKEVVDKTLKTIFLTEDDLERHKKMWIASEIRISERIDILVNSFIEDLVIYGKPFYNRIEIIKKLNMEELENIINLLDMSNNSFVLMIPKQNN